MIEGVETVAGDGTRPFAWGPSAKSSTARRVLPQIRTALLRVAARARFVDRVADLQHADVVRPVRAVAGGALHLALAHRHVSRFLHLHRFLLWQLSQVSVTVTVFSCALADLGLCTLWQVTHETLRAS
jgi:hypothetical protein